MNEDLIRQFIAEAPLAKHLGIEIKELRDDEAIFSLPFAETNVTIGDTVHGGAISALIDATATGAAWATDEIPENMRGTTVALTVNFLAGANGADLQAHARVIKRGRSLCYLEVDVTDPAEKPVAKGLITYKMG